MRRVGDGAVFRYIQEQPGHVSGLVGAGNVVVNTYTYTPWGEPVTTQEQVPQPLRYAAREYDVETGLYFVRARYYDPQQGRFVSEDPIGLGGGLNQYAYAANDPVNLTDPMGLCPQEKVEVDTNGDGRADAAVYVCKGGGGILLPGISTPQGTTVSWGSLLGSLGSRPMGSGLLQTQQSPASEATTGGGFDPIIPFPVPMRLSTHMKIAECALNHYGAPLATGSVGATLAYLGEPTIQKPFRVGNATAGTSIASEYLSRKFPQKLPFRMPTPIPGNLGAGTRVLGRALGRAVPYVGWGLLAVDAVHIGSCVAQQ